MAECNLGYIERGRIKEITEAGYIVESLDRKGIVTPPILPIAEYTFTRENMVLFVLFPDGTGKIISGA